MKPKITIRNGIYTVSSQKIHGIVMWAHERDAMFQHDLKWAYDYVVYQETHYTDPIIFNKQFIDDLTFESPNFKTVTRRNGVLVDVHIKDHKENGTRWFNHNKYGRSQKHLAYRIRVKLKPVVIKKLRQDLRDEWNDPFNSDKFLLVRV